MVELNLQTDATWTKVLLLSYIVVIYGMASPFTLRSGLSSPRPKLLSDMTDYFLEAKNKDQTFLR